MEAAALLADDPRWELANRVAASSKLRRSQRLRDLLLFITEWSLVNPQGALREQDIGVSVFHRDPHYDTSEDTIVRVHIFQLRKRLKEYFETEGASEGMILGIPKGGYTPEFHPRTLSDAMVTVIPAQAAAEPKRRQLPAVVIWFLVFIAGCLAGWMLRSNGGSTSRNAADRFWIQMFGNRRPTELVIADSSLSLYQEMLERNLSVQEYQGRQWDQIAESMNDPVRRRLANLAMTHHYTTFPEALGARDMGLIAAKNNLPLELVYAREFPARDLEDKNIILDGNRRANPWMSFFEDRLNFRYDYDDAHKFGYFRNVKPEGDERSIYKVEWNHAGYCRIAYVPNLNRTGTALILAGTDLSSAEAGERFVTTSEWISQLRDRLDLKEDAPIPHFEILLKTDLAIAASPRFEIAAVRVRPE